MLASSLTRFGRGPRAMCSGPHTCAGDSYIIINDRDVHKHSCRWRAICASGGAVCKCDPGSCQGSCRLPRAGPLCHMPVVQAKLREPPARQAPQVLHPASGRRGDRDVSARSSPLLVCAAAAAPAGGRVHVGVSAQHARARPGAAGARGPSASPRAPCLTHPAPTAHPTARASHGNWFVGHAPTLMHFEHAHAPNVARTEELRRARNRHKPQCICGRVHAGGADQVCRAWVLRTATAACWLSC